MRASGISGRPGPDRSGPPVLRLVGLDPACADCHRSGLKLFTVGFPTRLICDGCFDGALATLRNLPPK